MDSHINKLTEDRFPWDLGVYDAHCHPTDNMSKVSTIPQMKARGLTVMGTRSQDQELVEQIASSYAINNPVDLEKETRQCCVIPCFGWHPWFSHLMYDDTTSSVNLEAENFKLKHYRSVLTPSPEDKFFLDALPQPHSLSKFLGETRIRLEKYPTALVGEIGLDKAFRLPEGCSLNIEDTNESMKTPGMREGRRLTPYRVKMEHQKVIFRAQLQLASELNRPLSVHGVQAHGILFNTLEETWKNSNKEKYSKKRALEKGSDSFYASQVASKLNVSRLYPPRICLHSYSGSSEQAKQYLNPKIPAEIYFSFSALINNFSSVKVIEVIKIVPENRILAESDFDSAGDRMDNLLQQAYRQICEIKGWELQIGVAKLGMNWRNFIFSSV
ncbi:hypothetical protein K3495_g13773 [Podosphaera aphanis]|nr:hypothetical protein K3495_g13773 [Podosphaera aphanis]